LTRNEQGHVPDPTERDGALQRSAPAGDTPPGAGEKQGSAGRANAFSINTMAKGLVGLGLLLVLFLRIDFAAVWAELRGVRWGWLALVVILPHVAIWISAVKWRLLLARLGVTVTMSTAFWLYMIGTFFNNFLPSSAGGDVVRALELRRESEETGAIVAATLAERLIGFAALLTLLPLALLDGRVRGATAFLPLAIGASLLALVAGVWLLLSGRMGQAMKLLGLRRVGRAIDRSEAALRRLLRDRGAVQHAFLLSIAFYGLAILTVWVASRALDHPLGIFGVNAVVPLVLLVGSLPISLNGLGTKEAAYVFLLGLLGMPPATALALAVLLRTRAILTAIAGGIAFVVRRPARARESSNGDERSASHLVA